ncbi:CD209 antigen-like protein C [Mugil cephalus]|uniref:CD209 antigen-like protein C n=1 Tax=Mugil cephalus TaxID=48193 RepID=UPI001FB62258|nr:CD209 antigen-like protein C [Mugil cephalus]
MEEIYESAEQVISYKRQHSTNHTGPTSCSYLGVTTFLGLLSIFLLVRLIILNVHYNMTALLKTTNNKLSSMTEERDLLKAELTKMAKEMERLQILSKQKKTCPQGWKMFSYTCHFLSEASGSWDEGRQDCRNRGADLVVIDSPEEQTSVADFIKRDTWIGLNDKEEEGTWKWIDGTPVTLKYWASKQPDNGDQKWGEEDCAQFLNRHSSPWNDVPCSKSLPWMCEKIP